MRLTTKLFITFQALDLDLTLFGLSMGLREANPFGEFWKLFVCKIAVIICLGIILQIKRYNRIDYVIPVVSGLVIPYNLYMIILYL